jgi:hypothetical protein
MRRGLLLPVFVLMLVTCFLGSCKKRSDNAVLTNQDISNVVARMTDLMVHDVTNPPLAARFFSYACLAGYEIVSKMIQSSAACTEF